MPINDTNPLSELVTRCGTGIRKPKESNPRIRSARGKNDTEEHARALLKLCKVIPSKVNLIEYNPIDDGEFQQASEASLNMYMHILEEQGITTRIRKSRGKDIDVACGQLANKS